MKRSTKQLLSMLLAIVMVVGLMAPAMAATPIMGEVAETPVVEAEAPVASRPTVKAPAKAELAEAWAGTTTGDTWKASLPAGGAAKDVVVPGAATGTVDIATVNGVTLRVANNELGWWVDNGTDSSKLAGFDYGFEAKKDERETVTNPGNGLPFQFVVGADGVGKTLKITAKMQNKVAHLKKDDVALENTAFTCSAESYVIDGTTKNGSAADACVITIPNLTAGTYTVSNDGSRTRLYGFEVADAGSQPEEVDMSHGLVIDNRWYAPATLSAEVLQEMTDGVDMATVSGVTLHILPSTWKTSGPNDDGKKLGFVQGISSGTKAKNANGEIATKVSDEKPNGIVSADETTKTPLVPTGGTALQFKVGNDVPANTKVRLYYKANKKPNWLIEETAGTAAFVDPAPTEVNTGKNSSINPGPMEFTVKAGSNYYVFATGGNAAFFGFEVLPGGTAPAAGEAVTQLGTDSLTVVQADPKSLIPVMTNQAQVYAAASNDKVTVAVNGKAVEVTPGEADSAVGVCQVWIIADAAGKDTDYDTAAKIEAAGGKRVAVTVEAKPVVLDDPTLWVANKDQVPGGGKALTEETEVPLTGTLSDGTAYTVAGVKLYVGTGTYKFATATDMQDGSGSVAHIVGDGNPTVPSDGKDVTAKGEVPTKGTYYKFVATEKGVLQTKTVLNAAKTYWVLVDEVPVADEGIKTDKKVLREEAVVMEAGQTVYIYCDGSKLGLHSVQYFVGDNVSKKATWDKATICGGDAAYTVTPVANKDGTISVSVGGARVGTVVDGTVKPIALINYADELAVTMYRDGEEVGRQTTISSGTNHDFTFKPDATGKYSFKASASRSGEATTLDSAESAQVEFTLPLAVPSIDSVASNGLETDKETASVTVSWASVPEASSYELYCRAKGATAWGTAIPVTATTNANVNATVTGLTVGAEYEFSAKALRAATTINGVAVPAGDTKQSDAFAATIAGSKQIAWATKVFGTSATDQSNSVVEGKYEAKFSVVDDKGNPIPGAPNHEETIENLTGDLNTDSETPPVITEENKVTAANYGDARLVLSSRDGAGKITEPNGSDGLLFHYTTVPAGYNYSLKAKVHVSRWQTRDTQNGLGLAALDRVPAVSQTGSASKNAGDYWNNSYMVGAARLSFRYDAETGNVYGSDDKGADAYTNYSYYMGLCSITKHGTPEGYDAAGTVAPTYQTRRFPLDTRLCKDGVTAKYNGTNNRFNTIGNYSKVPAGWSAQTDTSGQTMHKYEMTDFILELKKTPTGYTSTAWTLDGELLGTNTEYYAKGAAELSGTDDNNPYTHTVAVNPENAVDQSNNKDKGITNMDPSAEYVGFFTSRDTDALFTNVEFKMWRQSDDPDAAQLPPPTTVKPTLTISSGNSSNSEKFTLSIATNVDGFVTVTQDGSTILTDEPIEGEIRLDKEVTLKPGANTFKVNFTVDPNQTEDPDWPPFTLLDTATQVPEKTSTVTYDQFYSSLTNIYVSPTANSTGRGTHSSPVDVYTAVSVVQPGQNIVLMDGEYKLFKTVRIGRGMDGTPEKPIYFMAEPGAKVVLNGQGRAGTVLVHGSDWWVFKDFEVVGSSSGATGFQLSGSNNIVQNVDTHDNGSTGFTVGRLSGSDKIPVRPTPETPADQVKNWGDWPCNNKIINCSSYRNYDSGYNGADGFGAKQTVGAGNVFDGCAAYWNADDGWDLFAKSEPDMGCIGVVTLKNCITFQNGYEVRKVINSSTQECEMEADGYTPKMNLDENGKIILEDAGNGNGFKLGGNHLPGAHVIENSYAFYNKAKGFDSNNGPDISVIDCTGYNNGDENVGLSSNSTVAYVVKNVVSFKDEDAPEGQEETKGLKDGIKGGSGNQIDKATYYKWTGKKCTNGSKSLTTDNFASLTFDNTKWINGAVRNEDGSLDLGDFLKLVDVADAGAGELGNDTKPVETPDAVTNPDPAEDVPASPGTSSGNSGSASAGAGKPDDGDKPVTPAPEKTYTADKKTNINGDTEIIVKDNSGEVVADVKIPATIPEPETKFDDVPEDHWAEESINNMAALGVVNGVGGNKYDMDSAVTRGTIATMLYRFASGKAGKTNPFTDVAAGKWYTDAIAWAADSGVVTGYSETTFGPDDTITREQLAVMLYRFAKLIGMDGTVADSALADYNDVNSVDDWAAEGMAWCVSKGIINGVSADTLSPTTSATRAQTATMLNRFIGLMK